MPDEDVSCSCSSWGRRREVKGRGSMARHYVSIDMITAMPPCFVFRRTAEQERGDQREDESEIYMYACGKMTEGEKRDVGVTVTPPIANSTSTHTQFLRPNRASTVNMPLSLKRKDESKAASYGFFHKFFVPLTFCSIRCLHIYRTANSPARPEQKPTNSPRHHIVTQHLPPCMPSGGEERTQLPLGERRWECGYQPGEC